MDKNHCVFYILSIGVQTEVKAQAARCWTKTVNAHGFFGTRTDTLVLDVGIVESSARKVSSVRNS